MQRWWHLFVVLCILYVSWRAIGIIPPRLPEQRVAKYHYVNAGICCTLGQLVFMFLLYRNTVEIEVVLPFLCFFTWTCTLIVILLNLDTSVFSRRFSILYLGLVPFILLLYPGGARGLLDDVDNFSLAVLRGATAAWSLAPTDSSATRPPIQASHFLKAIFFFVQTFLVVNYYTKMWYYRYQDKVKNTPERALGRDAAKQVILVLSIASSLWVAFVMLGFDTVSVSIFSGLVAVAVSVALRDLLANFLAGMLLLWDKSIKIGDVIALDKSRGGRVMDITMRYMIIQDRNDIEFLVPHTQLINTTVENWTRESKTVRLKLDIGVAYGSPIEEVKEIMRAVCFEVPRVLRNPQPNPLITSMDDSAIHFQLRFKIADPDKGIRNVMSEVYEKLLQGFEKAGIEIPYPQREFRLRKPARIDRAMSSDPIVRA